MLVGKCPKCGTRYYGWSLKEPRNQMCSTCGVGLEITDDSGNAYSGYSPFTAEEYKIKPPQDVPSLEDRIKEGQN
jgi:hypothetical protein